MQRPNRQAGRPWQRLRLAILQASPLCVNCEAKGRVAAAVEIDHVIPLAHGGTDDLVVKITRLVPDREWHESTHLRTIPRPLPNGGFRQQPPFVSLHFAGQQRAPLPPL